MDSRVFCDQPLKKRLQQRFASFAGMGHTTSQIIPFYRNVRVLAVLAQVAFAVGVAGLGWLLVTTMQANLRQQGIPISFAFLQQPAGFAISEGLPFHPSQSYLRAFGVGVVNTLRVAVTGIKIGRAHV